MLPRLRIILAAVLATCAAVLALSAGMLGTRDPGNDLSGVPEVSRTLVRQAIVAAPDWQQSQLLAYSRRADELLRLRDLPVTPARAVVDYAEQAQARAAEAASAPAAPAASEPAPTVVASTPAATPPTDAPATVAMATVATPPGDTTAATPVEPPASASPAPAVATAPVAAPPADTASATASASPTVAAPAPTAAIAAPTAAPAETPAAAPAASDGTKVAAVRTGGSETAEMYGPPKPKADGKPRHRARIVHPHPPKKKAEVAVANPRGAPAASPGFAANQPSNRNNAVGGWRSTNDSTPR